MDFYRIIPWVDMPDFPAVSGLIPGGAEKNSPEVHEFTEREIGEKDTDQKQMDIENTADP